MKLNSPSLRAVAAAAVVLSGCVLAATPVRLVHAAPAAINYKVVPAKSKFVVHSEVGGLANEVRSVETKDFSGSVSFDKKYKPLNMQMTIKANSFRSSDNLAGAAKERINNAVRDPILEAAKYPTISFKSTKITGTRQASGAFSGRILGNLTMHGVTRPVTIPVTGTVKGANLNAKGSFMVNQTDYKIKLLSLLGGAMKVEDPLRIEFNIVAVKS